MGGRLHASTAPMGVWTGAAEPPPWRRLVPGCPPAPSLWGHGPAGRKTTTLAPGWRLTARWHPPPRGYGPAGTGPPPRRYAVGGEVWRQAPAGGRPPAGTAPTGVRTSGRSANPRRRASGPTAPLRPLPTPALRPYGGRGPEGADAGAARRTVPDTAACTGRARAPRSIKGSRLASSPPRSATNMATGMVRLADHGSTSGSPRPCRGSLRSEPLAGVLSPFLSPYPASRSRPLDVVEMPP